MSVINRMLRDLDARRASTGGAGDAPNPAVRATPASPPRRQLWLLLLGGGVAISAAAFGDWPTALSKTARPPTPVAMVEGAEAVSAPLPQTPPATSPTAQSAAPTPTAVSSAESSTKLAMVPPTLPPTARADEPRAQAPLARVATARSQPAAIALPALTGAPHSDGLGAPAEAGSVDKRLLTPPAAQRALDLYRQALELATSGHGRAALEKLHDALKLDPGLLSARLHAVTLSLELGQPVQAEAIALQGLAVAPHEPQLTYLLARVLADRGDAAGAIAHLDRATRLSGEAFGLRAGLLAQRGEFERALHDYEQAVRAQPGNSLWWLGLGVTLEAAGHAPQARLAYARAQSVGIERHELNLFVDQKLVALEGLR